MILDRYVLRRFLGILTLCLVSVLVIFVAVDYVGNIRIWSGREFSEVRSFYAYATPSIIFMISPIAILLAALFTVSGFNRRLELMSMLSAGRPLWRILLPIWIAGIAYSALWVKLSDEILPRANAEKIRIRAPRNQTAFNDSPTKYQHVHLAEQGASLYFGTYDGEKRVGYQVTYLRHDGRITDHPRVVERIDAEKAMWDSGAWAFTHARIHRFSPAGELTGMSKRDSLRIRVPGGNPKQILSTKTQPDAMTQDELRERIATLKRAGDPTAAYEAEMVFKRSAPWVSAVVALIGGVLASLLGRRGIALPFGLGILLAFSYYVAIRAGLALGHAGDLTPLVAGWGANAFFFALGLLLLWRASRT